MVCGQKTQKKKKKQLFCYGGIGPVLYVVLRITASGRGTGGSGQREEQLELRDSTDARLG